MATGLSCFMDPPSPSAATLLQPSLLPTHMPDHFPGSKNGFHKIKNLKAGFFSKEDRSGHYSAVQHAIDAVPMWNYVTKIIYIKPGTYYGTVLVPKHKQHIRFVGNRAECTVLSYDRKANQMKTDGTEYGILDCATIIIEGSYFFAKGITFENASPKPDYLDFSAQAPAIRISGDYCAFYSCNFVGWQDTIFAYQGHHYYKDCRIEGSVDYILGYAAAVFETCTIRSKGEGFITAQSRWCNSGCAGADSYFAQKHQTVSGFCLGKWLRD